MADSYMGEIQIYGFNYAPYEWAMCSGQLMPVTQYTALFSLLGINYGGNGTANFALPNLMGRIAMGQGQGIGLTDRVIGESGGTENVALTVNEMPNHTHALTGGESVVKVSSQPGSVPVPTSSVNTLGALNDTGLANTNNLYNSVTPDIVLNVGPPLSGTIGLSGSSLPFGIMQPALGLNYCICLYGEYPVRQN